jgi:hypothetical protein
MRARPTCDGQKRYDTLSAAEERARRSMARLRR